MAPKNAGTKQRVTREHSPEMKDKLVEFIERKKAEGSKIPEACALVEKEIPHFKGMSAGSIESLFWYWRSYQKKQAAKSATPKPQPKPKSEPIPQNLLAPLAVAIDELEGARSPEPKPVQVERRKSISREEISSRRLDLLERMVKILEDEAK